MAQLFKIIAAFVEEQDFVFSTQTIVHKYP